VTARPHRLLAIVVLVIAGIGVVAGVVTATRNVPTLDRRTPEGVVQAYLSAVIAGHQDGAVAFLEPGSACTVDDLDRAFVPDGVRVVLRDTTTGDVTARVEVDVELPAGGPLDGSAVVEQHTFRLTRADGEWRIGGRPWPMFDCTGS
jgi:hypothetical protein